MPTPNPGESREDFVERCIPIVIDDGTAEDGDQAVAICNSLFGERAVPTSSENNTKHQYVLEAIRSRTNRLAEFGYGITTADQYVRKTIEENPGIKHPQMLIKEAEGKLAYANPDMVLVKEDMTATVASFSELLPDGVQPPEHTLMVFQHVLTTSSEDRDKDVLVTDGAMLDPKAPLLWQHMQTMLIGKVLATIEHTPDLLKVATVLLDLNELTADAAKLIEAEALRISHGFRALEFEERKRDPGDGGSMPGFRITKFEIMEASLVSVPSNIDAVINLYSSGKLASDFFRSHAKHYLAARPVQVAGHKAMISTAPAGSQVSAGTQLTLRLGGAEIDITAFDDVDVPDEVKVGAVKAAQDLEADPNIPTGIMTRNQIRTAFTPVEDDQEAAEDVPELEEEKSQVQPPEDPKEAVVDEPNDKDQEQVQETKDEQPEIQESDETNDDTLDVKGGRVISDKHLKVLKDIHGDLEEVVNMDNLPKAANALCERCITKLGGVIKAAHREDEKPKPGSKPDEDEKPKHTHASSAGHLLETDDMDLLRTTKESIEAILLVKQLDGKSEEYRHAVLN